ncbi:MAG: hypothetical protein A2750_02160 [Candidatus Yanofskybacteria bacterium RIFCSPHIGHO2_01_FULL_45_42]|uniref:Uncharacterized protein n=2 Tax=Candidatus Yanofskyibacteriota TaxID=1752733 RepID=A0A1F8FSC5_9BACT|nr:MAG: hypothetical protein A2750_02160 [Candidatus Yanofskybacteria bacterium RIFCSPHIGHO2_01_FULL_45_42]OGN16023.1 MAG: hypothetical protein A3J47_04045 [Candidatus Yanofskybacteria bacterium RIFCSPHIGHO2_02_FULL_43_22]
MENQSTIEQEIVQLEQQIAEKRAALGQEKSESQLPPEKEALHEIIGERIQQQTPQYQPRQGGAQPTPGKLQPSQTRPQHDDSALSYVLPELKDRVQELVNLVFNKGLDDGVKEATRSNNPALIDAFHDVLVDELYNMLVERKKLEPVK